MTLYNSKVIQLIFQLIKQKDLEVVIGGVYKLEEAAKVHELIENKKHMEN